MNLFRIAAYVLTDWPVIPSAVLRRLRLVEFSVAGARREGLIAQMFGIVLWAWNRIQSGLRGLVTCEGLH
jgi:hypothetical protein